MLIAIFRAPVCSRLLRSLLCNSNIMARHISEECGNEYERAVRALNSLQTTADVLERRKEERLLSMPDLEQKKEQRRDEHHHQKAEEKLLQTATYLEQCGIKLTDLDKLNAIHVTGTKGKGSVGAMCECILRKHGLKTGFFSSPHLLEVRERIRLNGEPLTKDEFVTYFWECYKRLEKTQMIMPAYFKFLTIMSFHVFLQEKTDVAVVEVGIGGAYDCTNIMPNPKVCAISSLGYDHMEVLGETLEKIAWQKGGIFKPGCPAFTAPQFPSAMRVLQERASELKVSSLQVVPPLADYPLGPPHSAPGPLTLGLAGEHQKINASLAAQACWAWLRGMGKVDSLANGNGEDNIKAKLHRVPLAPPFELTQEFRQGLEQCHWPGRAQVIKKGRVTYYLDGAHTPQSLRACAEWFKAECVKEDGGSNRGEAVRVLLFNVTKKRESKLLLQALLDCGFSYAGFSPNIAFPEGANTADQTNLMVTLDSQCARSKLNHQAWLDITSGRANRMSVLSSSRENRSGLVTSAPDPASLCAPEAFISKCNAFSEENARVFPCIPDFLQWCEEDISLSFDRASRPSTNGEVLVNGRVSLAVGGENGDHDCGDHDCRVRVLVTGSLHLVGATMSALGCKVEDL